MMQPRIIERRRGITFAGRDPALFRHELPVFLSYCGSKNCRELTSVDFTISFRR